MRDECRDRNSWQDLASGPSAAQSSAGIKRGAEPPEHTIRRQHPETLQLHMHVYMRRFGL